MERKRWTVDRWVGDSGVEYGDIRDSSEKMLHGLIPLAFANQIVEDHNAALLPDKVGVFLWDGSLATAIVNPPHIGLPSWFCDWYADAYAMDRKMVRYGEVRPIPSPTQEEIERYGYKSVDLNRKGK